MYVPFRQGCEVGWLWAFQVASSNQGGVGPGCNRALWRTWKGLLQDNLHCGVVVRFEFYFDV